ncbi:MAG: phenylalanine--tRNA ligase subunit alpha [Candidatus Kerfeldbacteria bacterium RIFCSPLOWO2_01_FULL_48_11]|uniref:Phenylalanine--tRNA ligase alpha subunit n=1 Tax=Candidatus Kerfeldbacteria bacterium RIFCSPLOWO2_01_FULL_48_11 TaxID=1798543 RepID=A0A1G2B154_9BACT|nr:MAG: Phenylalanine-tRNA ligase alpha subunit [Parcubacteria group bacterium GW2011_GWA2_48_9]KKW15652.1 MAG: Phenylalanine-tRNA ligase alpha subunit [Parcubacteria group bacterium GW2011_GWC2_49_9]OGY82912.1 MAG: phenylalanine--tRNA ligase subunit alpha [Candidatus Kerfeldbacteria bacterium RIFCSPLOWO2_01_FULL_48_11]HCJ52856.1 phenylalanine--tRNA ligase subunit alpha [Candidatus Kerfeldbacteria bacterium]
MIEKLKNIVDKAKADIGKAHTREELLQVQQRYLGRKGELPILLHKLSSLPERERPEAGQKANEAKQTLLRAIEEQHALVGEKNEKPAEEIDVTWPGDEMPRGHLHPITQFLRRVKGIFYSMGFEILDGPEVELQKYNFDLLNIPKDHPARDVWDTFFVRGSKEDLVLRTHTSPVQVRAMEKRKPPVRIIVPGRVFRHEATDASHEAEFYQCEGLVVDKGIRVTDLIGTLKMFLQETFEKKVRIRVRPEFYPFVEPGIDIDMSCLLCGGKGCPACKQSGWMEMVGSGMVHPKVLKNMGVDPQVYSGFAFGLGIDRLMMLYYGVDDVRLSYSGDLRFLEQF